MRCQIFILPPDADQLDRVEEIIQGVGAVPELMLAPEARGHRQEQELVEVWGAYAGEAAGREADPLSAKKPDRVHRADSIISLRQFPVSYSSSGYPHSVFIITG